MVNFVIIIAYLFCVSGEIASANAVIQESFCYTL